MRSILNKEQYMKLRARIRGGGGSREAHLAYGYVRGTEYHAMEKTANDKPCPWRVACVLAEAAIGPVWSDGTRNVEAYDYATKLLSEVTAFLRWEPKPPRVRKPRAAKPETEAAQ